MINSSKSGFSFVVDQFSINVPKPEMIFLTMNMSLEMVQLYLEFHNKSHKLDDINPKNNFFIFFDSRMPNVSGKVLGGLQLGCSQHLVDFDVLGRFSQFILWRERKVYIIFYSIYNVAIIIELHAYSLNCLIKSLYP